MIEVHKIFGDIEIKELGLVQLKCGGFTHRYMIIERDEAGNVVRREIKLGDGVIYLEHMTAGRTLWDWLKSLWS